MPSIADRDLLTRAFYEDCIWPSGEPRLEDAWLGIYQLLLWYAYGHIHIREANDLRDSKTWQQRATDAEAYIAKALNIDDRDLAAHVDRMMQLPRWRDAMAKKGTTITCPHCGQTFIQPSEQQRNNTLGNGLRILVAEVLRKWGDSRFEYDEEAPATSWFPGIQMPGRTKRAKMDILARTQRARAVVSCKWSARHDRMSDVTNECPQYKSAAMQQQSMDLHFFVVTNELDGQRTDKVLAQPCMDGLVMIHLPMAETIGTVTDMMKTNMASGRLIDLAAFVQQTYSWKA